MSVPPVYPTSAMLEMATAVATAVAAGIAEMPVAYADPDTADAYRCAGFNAVNLASEDPEVGRVGSALVAEILARIPWARTATFVTPTATDLSAVREVATVSGVTIACDLLQRTTADVGGSTNDVIVFSMLLHPAIEPGDIE